MIHGHGDDIFHYPQLNANFSSNIYQHPDLSGLHQYLCAHIETIHSYPEPDASSIRNKIAHWKKIDADCICVSNGATEAIYLIAQLFSGLRSTIIQPTFSEYADAARVHGHQLTYAADLDEVDFEHTDVLWLCHPNNPTGQVYNIKIILSCIERYSDTVFVIDQSYEHFAETPVFNDKQALCYPNMILLHSLTKHFAIPGLRLGYCVTNSGLLARINAIRMPWSVNQMALLAADYLLEHRLELAVPLTDLFFETRWLQTELKKFDQLEVFPTQTHFFLVRLQNGQTAANLKEYLALHHGILIRDAGNFPNLDAHYFRLATQSRKQNDHLIAALECYFSLGQIQ